ncbi:hypothetical protein Huta_0864 [Halorhabdus utahensis DSM 12940]|uniref:Uncharacterized protein n=1 Tax=Halorhabdus utahensis (strain DSM 12940 / JCM 11049 / AX-2) TaxID=519442 RepID=C7NUF0_HALUD|nr:hypothetical protein [Halorhabdus utahensis]ACV11047.1 hypothetical protein Huta_0864 [Halorhabdus utahensis DSM 12940]
MNPLPWLLDWPPNRGTIAVFVVLTAFSVGTLVLFGGVTDEITAENVTIESTDLSVKLNGEIDFPDVEDDSVQTCMGYGTPGDSVSVLGDVSVRIPAERTRTDAETERLTLAVSLDHTSERTTQPLTRTGDVTTDVFWIRNDDETLAVNETAGVEISVLSGNSTVANSTMAMPVENGTRTYDC